MIGQGLALCAGMCAALASCCAKLAMASDSARQLCNIVLSSQHHMGALVDHLSNYTSHGHTEGTTFEEHHICHMVCIFIT